MTPTGRLRVLITLLGGSGAIHMIRPKVYEPIVPPRFGNARTIVYASGVAELACAALLANPGTRRFGGWTSAGLFAAVFPANIYAVKIFGNTKGGRAAALARLPLQLPMITTAIKVAREG
jgi:uncharacterized membrane protein